MKVRGVLNYLFRLIFLLVLPIGVVFYSGWNFGRFYERKAIRERLEEIDSIHRQDSIRQHLDISVMACDCIKQLNDELRKEFNDSVDVDTQLYAKGEITVNILAHYHKQNKNGTYRKGLSKIMLVPRYCPFCGKPYFEDDKR